MSDPIYCGLAFGSVSMDTMNNLRPCCNIVSTKFKPTNDKELPFINRINSKSLRDVRKSLINGEWPELCNLCENTESIGSESMRVIWNRNIPDAPMYEIVNPKDIKYLDISFGNKCNSKCMTCNPYCSDFWAEEYHHIYLNSIRSARLVPSSSISESTTHQLLDTFKHIEIINLLGGEPMVSDEHRLLLDKLIESGLSKNITLNYVSNLTVYDDELVSIWKKFKSVGASLSMDGIGLVNDYLRYPAKFDKIESNLKRYLDLTDAGEFGITLSCTISIFNFSRYYELLDHYSSLILEYKNQHSRDRMTIFLNYVNNPAHFNSSLLSSEFRKKALDKLDVVRNKIEKLSLHPSLVASCNTFEAWANEATKEDKDLISSAIRFIRSSDEFRKRDLTQYIPEVMEELLTLESKYGK